ncbi:MAG: hypothetical protein BWY32_03462 [bacterium ADurb.Bin243]|nr:MAG: hypothetical protein BWY32_03462 [bacterium ADurb.Bin243]
MVSELSLRLSRQILPLVLTYAILRSAGAVISAPLEEADARPKLKSTAYLETKMAIIPVKITVKQKVKSRLYIFFI